MNFINTAKILLHCHFIVQGGILVATTFPPTQIPEVLRGVYEWQRAMLSLMQENVEHANETSEAVDQHRVLPMLMEIQQKHAAAEILEDLMALDMYVLECLEKVVEAGPQIQHPTEDFDVRRN